MKRPLIAAALALGLLATPALAATSNFPIEVEFTRANLDTAKGAAAEYKSIRDQVEDRCEAENAGIKFFSTGAIANCTKITMDATIEQIDNPNLSKVHAQNS